ncbi:aldo/keto reductase [Pseudogemmobacter humi]|uniref:General stress protein 69 n=1 Tax=Pseudogemmobacter humi TaxID=2483812 RepID=A0A3P5WUG4_9RHOB|nr:aldo/keto reductase [Pseudogemmobacter humi]VDC25258.1 General stress protein 69 [Pseudogemmobacter humi]
MQKRNLGRHRVGAIGLGAMSFGGIFGATDEATSLATLDAAWEAGITHFDTANIYGSGVSESVIGTWLRTRGHTGGSGPVIATKAGIVDGPPRRFDNSAACLRSELEASLKRLGCDHVGLFYIHRREAARPLEEVVGTLSRLIEEGKIGGYGLSEIAPATLRAAHAIHPVTAVQNEYSLWSRQPELGLIRACADLGVTFVAFSPLARGMLGDTPLPRPTDGFRGANPRFTGANFAANTALVDGFRAFCRARGWTTAAAALAWVLHRDEHVIPIPGTRSARHLADWQGADAIRFTPGDLAEIERLLPAGFAHGDRYGDHQLHGVERYC